MKRGFGELIERARLAAGYTPEQLTERLGRRSKSIVYRLESESQEPDVATINALVRELPISAEELLKAMGVHFNPPAAMKLPRELGHELLSLTDEETFGLLSLLRRSGGGGSPPAGAAQ